MAKSQVIEKKIRGYAQTIIFKWANPDLFLFPSFQAQIFTEKTVRFSGIQLGSSE